jgi:peptide deformylase
MALLNVLQFPDVKLRNQAQPVTAFDSTIIKYVEDMFETMYEQNAIGLASIQVSIPLNIIVIDVSDLKDSPLCIINPEIIQSEGIQEEFEGCLSFPGVFDKIERAMTIRLRAQDQHGKTFEIDADGLLSNCIQHEMDHLNGILFIDHLSRLKQDRLRRKLEKLRARTY